ncbi:EamA domain-containing protein [uncultured Gammaproteobacteria bacterium]
MIEVLLITIMVLADSASDVLVARSMKRIGPVDDFKPRSLLALAGRVVRCPSFLLGITMAAVHFGTFLALLSFVELSVVVPAGALVYVTGTLGARLVLHERVDRRRWIGVGLIAAGVALVALA